MGYDGDRIGPPLMLAVGTSVGVGVPLSVGLGVGVGVGVALSVGLGVGVGVGVALSVGLGVGVGVGVALSVGLGVGLLNGISPLDGLGDGDAVLKPVGRGRFVVRVTAWMMVPRPLFVAGLRPGEVVGAICANLLVWLAATGGAESVTRTVR